jgi:hypothetical protein
VIGPGPVLQYRPAQTDSAWRVFGQSLGCDCARHRVAVPANRCHLPSRPPRAAHAAATLCATPLASARMLASRTRQLYGRYHLKALLSVDRCRPATTSAPHSTHAATARAPYPLAIGPDEKSFTPLPTASVELPPLRSTPPSPPFPGHHRPPPLVLLWPHQPHL